MKFCYNKFISLTNFVISSNRITGIYSDREQFRGPELTKPFDITELQNITVDIRRKKHDTSFTDPAGRQLIVDDVTIQRRQGTQLIQEITFYLSI